MAKETLSELVIGLSLDTEEFLQGIEVALQKVQKIGETIRGALGSAAGAVSTEGGEAVAAAKQTGDAVKEVGDKAKEAASNAEKSFGKLPPLLTTIRSKIMSVAGSLTGAIAAAKLFDNYIGQGKGLNDLSRKIGMSVETIDAWSKANEAAGGTAEALQSSLEAFYRKTGRPATEFLRLGEKIEGMSRLQAQRFLEAQGVALDAIPVFLKGQKYADELVAKYRKTAFTTQDAKNAQAFKTAWLDFKVAAQDVGNVFLRLVVPAFTQAMNMLSRAVSYVREHTRLFTILGALLSAVFAVKTVRAIGGVTAALRGFGIAVGFAFKPVTLLAALIGALALSIDDLAVFANGGESAIEAFLQKNGIAAETIETLRSSIKDVKDAFAEAWDAVKPWIGDALVIAFKVIAAVIGGIAVLISSVVLAIAWLVDAVKSAIDWFGELDEKAKAWLDELSADCKALGQDIANWFSSIPDRLIKAFGNATDAVSDFFSGWFDLFKDKVLGPIKDAWGGVKSFFGFGGDGEETGSASATAQQQAIVVMQGKYAPPSITSSSNLYMTNNIQTRDDPGMIARTVGQYAYQGAQRSNNAFYQSMNGVRLK